MKIHSITFGCQMSSADGDELSRPWRRRGYTATPDLADADAVIVNTCTVRQHAEDRAVSLIGRLRVWKQARPGRTLIVAGCAAERIGDWLRKRFPHIDLVVGARSIDDYPGLLDQALGLAGESAPENYGFESSVSASVTIMRGCNYACTYCIVPSVRGPEICRPLPDIVEEVRARVEGGTKEVVLLGQTVNGYRDPAGRAFPDLLRAVGAVDGLRRLRFMSPHPFYMNDALMAAMAETPAVAPQLHLPVQSGSDPILARMRRNYTAGAFLEKISRLRRLIPDLALSTDFIVGFPGESEEDFAKTLALVENADFCSAYCYKFSPREGTPAATMPDDVAAEVKVERLARLLELVEAKTIVHLDRLRGKAVNILLEDATDGRTQYHFKARLSAPGIAGEMVAAEVTGRTLTALKAQAAAKEALA